MTTDDLAWLEGKDSAAGKEERYMPQSIAKLMVMLSVLFCVFVGSVEVDVGSVDVVGNIEVVSFVLKYASIFMAAVLAGVHAPGIVASFRGQIAYVLLFLYMFISVLVSSGSGGAIVGLCYNVFVCILCVVAVYTFKDDQLKLIVSILMGAMTVVVLSIAAYILNLEMAYNYDTFGVARFQGVTRHPNVIGVVSFISIWALAYMWQASDGLFKKFFYLASASLPVFCIYKSNSMTSMAVSFGAVVVMVCLDVFQGRFSRFIMAATSSVVLSMVIIHALSAHSGGALADKVFDMMGRGSDFTGRTGLWLTGLTYWLKKPIIGFGFERMPLLESYGIDLSHFHNGYVEIALRGGIIGILLMTWLAAGSIMKLLRKTRSPRRIVNSFLVLLAMLLLHNITETSFLGGLRPGWIALNMAFCYANLRESEIQVRRP